MSNPPRVTFDRNGIIVTGDSIVYNREQLNIEKTDNTSDLNKPISTATQNALNLKAPLANPTFTGTVTGVTKGMVGLGNVDNTSDLDKPTSTATQDALNLKASLTNPYFPLDLHVNNKLTVGGELVVGNIATFNNNVTYNGTVYADKIFIAGGGMKFDQSATANVLSQNMIDYITGLMGSS